MNSEGMIRFLTEGEQPRADEVLLTQEQADRLGGLTELERRKEWQELAFAEQAPSVRKQMRAESRKTSGRSRFEALIAASAR